MRRYLFVDDNVPLAENLAEIARDVGAEVDIVESGAEALELAQRTRYDALLTDMRMPLMGGAELVHQIRRIDPGLAAIVATAYVGDNALQAARQEGLLAVLAKPVPVQPLLELLARARRDGLAVVIEDDLAMSDNVTELLRSRGFAAVTAASVLETERLGPVQPFCALVDLRIPGGPDGEAMSRLALKYPGLPQIVVTAHSDEAPPLEPHRFFAKPFDTEKLLDAIERLHRARAEAR